MHMPNLSHIALLNPTLGYIIDVMKPRLVPRVYRLVWVFTNASIVDQPYERSMDQTFVTDAWLYEAEYSVRRPNGNAGSVFKGQNDVNTELKPSIDITLKSDGLGPNCDFPIIDSPTPIEHCARASVSSAPYSGGIGDCLLLQKRQLLRGTATLRRTLQADENPFIVTLAFKTYQVDSCNLCGMEDKDVDAWRKRKLACAEWARSEGILNIGAAGE